MDKRRIKLLVLDIVERMNKWEEITICEEDDYAILYHGLSEDVPPSLLNYEVMGIGISSETVLLYTN